MGKQLGAFDPSNDLDRPDLNKCPDCSCYFAADACPLCGKICPEDMRAGKRAPEKKKKKRGKNHSGRVMFIPWYYSWWFILIMMFIFPLVGIILFFTSPYSKKWKIIISIIAVVYMAVVYTGLGGWLISHVLTQDDQHVNSKLTQEQYEETCQSMDADSYFRLFNRDGYYTMELVVEDYAVTAWDYYDEVPDLYMNHGDVEVIYLCRDPNNPSARVFVADCQIKDAITLRPGDRITVWGQGESGKPTTMGTTNSGSVSAPILYAAYIRLCQQEGQS